MKKILIVLLLAAVSCAQKESKGTGIGFVGDIVVSVKLQDDKISDIKLIADKETRLLMSRAFPIMKERILAENTPVVDSVSGATYTSFGIKVAVANALKELKQDVPNITMATKSELPTPSLEDTQTDVLIIGGGPAGLAAAIEAKEAGADVIIVEKLDILSGNGKFDKDFYDMVNTKADKKAGLSRTADSLYEELIVRKTTDTPERIRAYSDGASKIDEWLRNRGITLDYLYASYSYMHTSNAYAGEHIQDNIEKAINKLGVEVRTGTQGIDLIMENGAVQGAIVQYKDKQYNIRAKAVIVATGGFSANNDLIAKYRPDMPGFYTSNQEQNKGDFISVFEKNKMGLRNLNVFNMFPFTYPKTRALTGTDDPRGDFILVNTDGNRFVNEKTDRELIAKTIQSQKTSTAYYIYDQSTKDICYRLQSHEGYGWVTKGNTIEELAEKLQINPVNLSSTLSTYNQAILGEVSDPMGRPTYNRTFSAEGPYYAIPVRSAYHMTRGGVTANEKAQVLYTDGSVVPGLYAAGEVTDFIIGAYMGAYVFGRIAGQEAANYVK